MKKTLLSIFTLLVSLQLLAQKFEYSIQANTGLMHYSGDGAATASVLNSAYPYITDPFSRENTVSYGFSIQDQCLTKNGFIIGLQAGFDILRSKINIDEVNPPPPTSIFYTINTPSTYPATGSAFLQNTYININPYIGYRFSFGRYQLDILPGVDFGLGLGSHESAKAIANSENYVVDTTLKKPPLDVRLRLGIAANYRHYSLTASYAHGITNDDRNQTGGNVPKVYSELFRFGLGYRF